MLYIHIKGYKLNLSTKIMNNNNGDKMPPDIYFWIHNEIDGGDLHPFIDNYKKGGELYQNPADLSRILQI